ncbi:hypothetical protein Acor_21470 [Acrocarpospora corrugata]|uniref:Uncharacterized protein n=1 Tax=Acrocarpospora corrugata TaxID=35763 RepID=A0A5M3VU83_9ACTN|nr:hypothetical protein Acor_21470 [Acrocarpospora corrugata]
MPAELGGKVELAQPDTASKSAPLTRSEISTGPSGFLTVPHHDSTADNGHLHTLPIGTTKLLVRH